MEVDKTEEKPNEGSADEAEQNTETTTIPENSNNKTVKANLKIYSMPSVTAKVVGNAEKGKIITVNYELNNWVNITYGNIEGWARKYFINIDNAIENSENHTENEQISTEEKQNSEENKIPEENQNPEKTPEENTENKLETVENKVGYINASVSANIRESASTSSNIVTILTKNTQVKIIGAEGDFYKIQFQEYTGYIAKYLISDKPI